jgi:type II secretory pathway component PulC
MIKQLLRNINIINTLLVVTIIYFFTYYFSPTLNMQIKFTPPEPDDIIEVDEYTIEELSLPSNVDYTIISEENLFHPERKIPVEKKVEQPLPKPEFVLYGTLVSENISIAYLEDLKAPRNTPGRGKRIIPLRKGQTLSGFKLEEIETDRIVMTRGEEKIIVPINDPSRPKERQTVTTTQTPPPPQPQPAPQPRRIQPKHD